MISWSGQEKRDLKRFDLAGFEALSRLKYKKTRLFVLEFEFSSNLPGFRRQLRFLMNVTPTPGMRWQFEAYYINDFSRLVINQLACVILQSHIVMKHIAWIKNFQSFQALNRLADSVAYLKGTHYACLPLTTNTRCINYLNDNFSHS